MYRDDQVAMGLEHSETLREEAEKAKQMKEERKKRAARFERAAQDLLWDCEPTGYGVVGIICAVMAFIFIAIGLPIEAYDSLVERPQTMRTQASCLNICGTQEKPVAAVTYQKKNNSCICMRDGKPDTRAFLKGM